MFCKLPRSQSPHIARGLDLLALCYSWEGWFRRQACLSWGGGEGIRLLPRQIHTPNLWAVEWFHIPSGFMFWRSSSVDAKVSSSLSLSSTSIDVLIVDSSSVARSSGVSIAGRCHPRSSMSSNTVRSITFVGSYSMVWMMESFAKCFTFMPFWSVGVCYAWDERFNFFSIKLFDCTEASFLVIMVFGFCANMDSHVLQACDRRESHVKFTLL